MMQTETARKIKAKYITPIDEAELTCRILEAATGFKRPVGATAIMALESIEAEYRGAFRRAARAAMEYWRECIENAQRPS